MTEAAVERHTTEGKLHLRDHLSREEITELLRMQDWRSWLSVAVDWGVVFAAMGRTKTSRWISSSWEIGSGYVPAKRSLSMAAFWRAARA